MNELCTRRPAVAQAATIRLSPVAVTERLDVLDVLRGFALFGVLFANVVWFLSGYGELEQEKAMRLPTAAFDPIVLELETFFVVDKFISIFCFLFGVGFALQMRRASERGADVRRLYVRRMLWLFLFGVAHAVLIFYGDILHLYAVLGLLLIGWVSRSDRTIVGWGLAFALLVPVALRTLLWGLPFLTGGAIDPAAVFEARWNAAAALHVAFAHGSYAEVIRANVADVWAWLSTDDALTKGVSSFGKILLGFWAGRTGILVRASSSRANAGPADPAVTLMRRGFVWGLALGVTCQGVLLADDFLPALDPESWAARVGRTALWHVGVLALAASYVCAIVLLFRRPAWRRPLQLLLRWAGWPLRITLVKASSASLSSTGWGSVGTAASAPPPRLRCPSASLSCRRSSARGGSSCSDSGRPSGLGDRSHTGGDNPFGWGGRHNNRLQRTALAPPLNRSVGRTQGTPAAWSCADSPGYIWRRAPRVRWHSRLALTISACSVAICAGSSSPGSSG